MVAFARCNQVHHAVILSVPRARTIRMAAWLLTLEPQQSPCSHGSGRWAYQRANDATSTDCDRICLGRAPNNSDPPNYGNRTVPATTAKLRGEGSGKSLSDRREGAECEGGMKCKQNPEERTGKSSLTADRSQVSLLISPASRRHSRWFLSRTAIRRRP